METLEDKKMLEINNDKVNPYTLIEKALDRNIDITTLERLFDLQEKWDIKQSKKAYYSALANFQAECPEIKKEDSVKFESRDGRSKINYNYASLPVIDKTIKPVMAKYGLSKTFKISEKDGILSVTCKISHIDGYSEETTMDSAPDSTGNKNTIQSKGSTSTYLQRYTLIGALGLVTADEDNDGTSSELKNTTQSKSENKVTQNIEVENSEKTKLVNDFELAIFNAADNDEIDQISKDLKLRFKEKNIQITKSDGEKFRDLIIQAKGEGRKFVDKYMKSLTTVSSIKEFKKLKTEYLNDIDLITLNQVFRKILDKSFLDKEVEMMKKGEK